MLIDPDDDSIVDVFPAIPSQWEYKKVAFEGLMTTGALIFSAERNGNDVKVEVTNKANAARERKLRIKIPALLEVQKTNDLMIEEGFIVKNISLLPGETKSYKYTFSPKKKSDPVKMDMEVPK